MLTTELFIAIISLCITCFALGYTLGSKSNDKTPTEAAIRNFFRMRWQQK
jgi:hypothetical protein